MQRSLGSIKAIALLRVRLSYTSRTFVFFESILKDDFLSGTGGTPDPLNPISLYALPSDLFLVDLLVLNLLNLIAK